MNQNWPQIHPVPYQQFISTSLKDWIYYDIVDANGNGVVGNQIPLAGLK